MKNFADDNTALFKRAKAGEESAVEDIIKLNMPLVHSLAYRLSLGGLAEYEELVSAGSMGLFKAVKNFDPDRELAFSTYAVPVVAGEMKRFIRDNGPVKVSRSIKERSVKVNRMRALFEREHGREPSLSELASLCSVTVEELNEALDCVQSPMSLDSHAAGDEGLPVALAVGREDEGLNIERLSLKEALAKLPEKDGQLITLRYFRGLTQRETAKCLNMTQVQVSRREKQILLVLRELLSA